MSNVVSFPGLGLEFEVNREALQFSLFGKEITLYWYGILIALGFLLAIVYAMVNAKRFKLDRDKMVDVIIAGTIGAIIFARLYYVIFSWSQYKDDFWSIFKIWEGGLAIYGGIIGAFLFGAIMCKLRKVNILDMCDLAGIGFLIGQCIGRWGNFFNQEAYGVNTTLPWGMTSEKISYELMTRADELAAMGMNVDPSVPVHPCFLYESLWCLLGFIILHFISKKRKFKGQVILSYVIWYGIGRSVIEGLRTDSLMWGTVRVSQLLSVLLVIVAIIVMIVVLRRKKENDSKDIMLALSSSSDAMTGETVRAIEDKTVAEEMLPEAENEADEDDDGGNDEETEEKTED